MFAFNFLPRAERRHLRALLVGGALALCTLGAVPALGIETSHLRVTSAAYGVTQPLTLELNKSVIIDLPTDVKEVIVGQPSVAPTIMRTKRRAIIQGLTQGATNVFFLDAAGRTISIIDVTVAQQTSPIATSLESTLARVLPGSNVRVETISDSAADGKTYYMLTGTVRSAQDKAVAESMATQLSESETPVSSLIQVLDSQQVMLKVTIAEVSRETIKQLGVNLSATFDMGNGTTLGLQSQQPLGGASGVATTNGFSAGINAGGLKIDAALRALERRGAVHMLAEPTLTAISGQEAEFLAGGQFPVPSGVDAGVLSFEFKEFGVRLKFTPTVKGNGVIALTVETSVTEPTTEGGFVLGSVTIPATRDRRARTSVELPAGCTLSIAGIFQDEVRQQINKLPGVGDIPILGALFRSRDFLRSQTELVILVTPYLAETGRVATPLDNTVIASDAEAIFLGRMENIYGVSKDGDDLRGGFNGSVGFVLD